LLLQLCYYCHSSYYCYCYYYYHHHYYHYHYYYYYYYYYYHLLPPLPPPPTGDVISKNISIITGEARPFPKKRKKGIKVAISNASSNLFSMSLEARKLLIDK